MFPLTASPRNVLKVVFTAFEIIFMSLKYALQRGSYLRKIMVVTTINNFFHLFGTTKEYFRPTCEKIYFKFYLGHPRFCNLVNLVIIEENTNVRIFSLLSSPQNLQNMISASCFGWKLKM
jgi:hypothetical protein